MAAHPNRVTTRSYGLLANPTKSGASGLAASLVDKLGAHGLTALVNEETAALLDGRTPSDAVTVATPAEIGAAAEFALVLGGDGTLLKTIRRFGPRIPPCAAINIGSLGFLTTAPADAVDRCVEALVSGEYDLSPRARLEVSYTDLEGRPRTDTALNEAVLARGLQPRMIDLEARIGGQCFNRYRSDGIIVATPTGSTAYALSAGGPLISPEAGVFVLTPICSHTMADRSLVFGDSTELELIPGGETLLTLDGDTAIPLPPHQPVRLRRATVDLPLITLPGHSFFRIVQSKLGWRGNAVSK